MEKYAINENGSTAMDVCKRSRNDVRKKEIRRSLKRAKVRAKGVLKPKRDQRARLVDHRNALMVVASLIATMAFQVGINPPGGVWQDNKPDTTATLLVNNPRATDLEILSHKGHYAGVSIMGDEQKQQYTKLMVLSSVALVSSLSVILLLISGLPCQKLFVGVLMITMWIAITAIPVTYGISIVYLSSLEEKTLDMAVVILIIWAILMFTLLLIHVSRYMVMLIKKLVQFGKTAYHNFFSRPATADNIHIPA